MPNTSTTPRETLTSDVFQASFARPSDTNAYAAGDVIGPTTTPANQSWDLARIAGQGFRLRAVSMHKSDKNITNAAMDLVLFDAAPVAIADNAEWLPTDAEMLAGYVGFVELLATDWHQCGGATNATGAMLCKSNLDLPLAPASTSKTLYGVLVARGAWTPTSAEVITINLHVERE